MAIDNIKQESWNTYYNTYFQELASQSLASLWEKVDIGIMLIVALTASGSAVAGWTLWSLAGWKVLWGVFAGIASVVSITHTTLRVPDRVKQQEELRRRFSEVRVEFENFLADLRIGMKEDEARKRFKTLQGKYSECMKVAHLDILFTVSFRNRVTNILTKELQGRGMI